MKFEKAGPNQTLVIDSTRLYMKDRQTGAKQYTPLLRKGGSYKNDSDFYLIMRSGQYLSVFFTRSLVNETANIRIKYGTHQQSYLKMRNA